MDDGTRTAAQALYRLMRAFEAAKADPATRSEAEAFWDDITAAAALPYDGSVEVGFVANNLTRAAAEFTAAHSAAHASLEEIQAAMRELYPGSPA